jgi:GNAT superfamily N-acetyltransferase
VSDQDRDVERGLYGRALPVRPAPRGVRPTRCLRAHDLAIATSGTGYHHRYNLGTCTCNICWALRDPLHTWALVDPAGQHTAEDAPNAGLALVRIPPSVRGGTGQLQLRIDGVTLADLGLAVCGPCRRAVLEQVRVDEPHRRQGFGRVLVAAALALALPRDYRWSSTTVDDHVIAHAFWAAVGWPGQFTPAYCTDMDRAAGRLPDW